MEVGLIGFRVPAPTPVAKGTLSRQGPVPTQHLAMVEPLVRGLMRMMSKNVIWENASLVSKHKKKQLLMALWGPREHSSVQRLFSYNFLGCQGSGGPASAGSGPCQFPYIFDGYTYTGCAVWAGDPAPWCSLKVRVQNGSKKFNMQRTSKMADNGLVNLPSQIFFSIFTSTVDRRSV